MELRGVELTFHLLAKTRNPAALPPLFYALESTRPQIQVLALRALLARREPAAHREIIERLEHWPEHLRQVVWEERSRLSASLRDAILSPDFDLSLRALRAAAWLREYDLAPVLVNMLLSPASPTGSLAADVLLELATAFSGEIQSVSTGSGGRFLEQLRTQFLRSLARAVEQYDLHRRSEVLIAYILVADPSDPLWQRVLDSSSHKAHRAFAELLARSARPEVIRLLLAQLERPEVSPVVLRIVSRRKDLPFIAALLSHIGRGISPALEKNLSSLRSPNWLEDLETILPRLDGQQQLGLVTFCRLAGIRRSQLVEILRLVLRDGVPEARKAAVELLASIPGPPASVLVCQALQDPDPDVQAAAVRQLRTRGIVGALPRLIELLDSPHPQVQNAARQSLQEFRFERFLAAFDLVDESVRQTTGRLVRKVDPTAIDRLKQELTSPVRVRRLRAIAMAEALQALAEVEEELVALAHDPDHMVRAAAVKVLGNCESPAAKKAVVTALHDPSPAVQHAAQAALAAMGNNTPNQVAVESS